MSESDTRMFYYPGEGKEKRPIQSLDEVELDDEDEGLEEEEDQTDDVEETSEPEELGSDAIVVVERARPIPKQEKRPCYQGSNATGKQARPGRSCSAQFARPTEQQGAMSAT